MFPKGRWSGGWVTKKKKKSTRYKGPSSTIKLKWTVLGYIAFTPTLGQSRRSVLPDDMGLESPVAVLR